jgi:hypothetical protein
MKKTYVTFRNDDVRETLEPELIQITDLFIKYKIPISHAVEPGNITEEVLDWLLDIKLKHPDLIEIIQHGFKHTLNIEKFYGGKKRKGEFGIGRSYKEQYEEIRKGKELMNRYFGSNWFQCFTFPYGGKDNIALKAANDVGYKVMNDHKGVSFTHKVFYFVGRMFRRNFIKGRSVSYHLKKRPNTKLFNIDMNVSVITKYHNEVSDCDMLDINQLISKVNTFRNERTLGVILHHRYHNTMEKIRLVDEFLAWCVNQPDFEFATQEDIYKKFSK